MHETGMCEAIVEAALRRGRGRRVTALRVRIGGHAVDEAVVRQGVQLAATGTPAEGARVDLVLEAMRVHCAGCGTDSPVTDHLALVACPRCGGVDVRLEGGDEVVLESITVEQTERGREPKETAWTPSSC